MTAIQGKETVMMHDSEHADEAVRDSHRKMGRPVTLAWSSGLQSSLMSRPDFREVRADVAHQAVVFVGDGWMVVLQEVKQ